MRLQISLSSFSMNDLGCNENGFSFLRGIFYFGRVVFFFFLNLGFFRENRFFLCQNQGSSDKLMANQVFNRT